MSKINIIVEIKFDKKYLPGMALKCRVSLSAPGARFSSFISGRSQSSVGHGEAELGHSLGEVELGHSLGEVELSHSPGEVGHGLEEEELEDTAWGTWVYQF